MTTAALLLSACLPEVRDSNVMLRDTMRQYASHIRWSRFDEAARWHTAAAAPVAQSQAERYRVVRVLSADLDAMNLVTPDVEAEATLKISYHLETGSNVRHLLHKQRWVYEKEGSVWRLDGPLPEFK
jgi:hypothetical protein